MKEQIYLNRKQGLYDPANEHDACGVGMLVNIHGGKSHDIVESHFRSLTNLFCCKGFPFLKRENTGQVWSFFPKTKHNALPSSVL